MENNPGFCTCQQHRAGAPPPLGGSGHPNTPFHPIISAELVQSTISPPPHTHTQNGGVLRFPVRWWIGNHGDVKGFLWAEFRMDGGQWMDGRCRTGDGHKDRGWCPLHRGGHWKPHSWHCRRAIHTAPRQPGLSLMSSIVIN